MLEIRILTPSKVHAAKLPTRTNDNHTQKSAYRVIDAKVCMQICHVDYPSETDSFLLGRVRGMKVS
jgi:hypothetical protein